MTLRSLVLAACLGLSSACIAHVAVAETSVGQAVDPARIVALTDTIMMGQVIAVMREEGLDYGKTLEEEMFAGRGGDRWQAIVGTIYDPDQMRQRFDAAMATDLAGAGDDLASMEAFFGSEMGQQILKLEIGARRALLDSDVEDAAKVAWSDMAAEDSPRAAQLRRFAEANDLIESNVMGAMNANFAFYRGMAEAGSFPEAMTEEQMLQDVWGQEPQVRTETESWLFPFLALAYQPLSDADLQSYISFSESPAGQRLNAALFVAFDAVFTQISADLGRAAALQMKGEDI